MTNENNTNGPRVPLTDEQKARQAAALAASKVATPQVVELKPGEIGIKPGGLAVTIEHKPVTPQVTAIPGTTPLGVKPDTAKPANPTVTGAPVKPISDLLTAATTALSNTDDKAGADVAVAALATAAALPVNPDKVASPMGKPGGKVLPDLTADAAHKAAMAKANESTGKPPQGGKSGGKKGSNAPATPAVTAAKPVKLTPRKQALANNAFVRGYDLSKWPVAMLAIKPTAVIIDAVRATNVLKTLVTKTELALCVYAMPNAQRFNVYDVATALQNVLGGSHDHKMNTVNQKAVPSTMWLRINPQARAAGLADGKMAIAYGVAPSPAGLKKIMAALGDKTPKHWLPETGHSKASDKGKVTPATTPPA